MILLVLASALLVMPPVPSLKYGTCLSVNVLVPLNVFAVCDGVFGNTLVYLGRHRPIQAISLDGLIGIDHFVRQRLGQPTRFNQRVALLGRILQQNKNAEQNHQKENKERQEAVSGNPSFVAQGTDSLDASRR